jgi:hypothetical protein
MKKKPIMPLLKPILTMSSIKPVKPRLAIDRRQRISFIHAKAVIHDLFPTSNNRNSNSKDNPPGKPKAVK